MTATDRRREYAQDRNAPSHDCGFIRAGPLNIMMPRETDGADGRTDRASRSSGGAQRNRVAPS